MSETKDTYTIFRNKVVTKLKIGTKSYKVSLYFKKSKLSNIYFFPYKLTILHYTNLKKQIALIFYASLRSTINNGYFYKRLFKAYYSLMNKKGIIRKRYIENKNKYFKKLDERLNDIVTKQCFLFLKSKNIEPIKKATCKTKYNTFKNTRDNQLLLSFFITKELNR